jgi:hypothetical protein
MVVNPRRGLLLAFPSDAGHVHEVLPVRRGVRYTMAIWFTMQQSFALPGFSVWHLGNTDGAPDARMKNSAADHLSVASSRAGRKEKTVARRTIGGAALRPSPKHR